MIAQMNVKSGQNDEMNAKKNVMKLITRAAHITSQEWTALEVAVHFTHASLCTRMCPCNTMPLR